MGWGIPKQGWTKGPWTPEEDRLLSEYVKLHGEGRWSSVSKSTGKSILLLSCKRRQNQRETGGNFYQILNDVQRYILFDQINKS